MVSYKMKLIQLKSHLRLVHLKLKVVLLDMVDVLVRVSIKSFISWQHLPVLVRWILLGGHQPILIGLGAYIYLLAHVIH